MKKLISLILSLVIMFGIIAAAPFSASAASSASGSFANITYDITDGVLTITGSGATGNVGYDDSKPWSEYRDSITKIVVSEGITSIGNNFLKYLDKVTEVELPSTLKTIGSEAFAHNVSITEITFPDGLESTGSMAFFDCTSLKTINFPDKANFDSWSFMYCGFTSIVIPDSFEGKISGYCFSKNDSLHIAVIGKGTKKIGRGVFAECNNLKNLIVSDDNPYYTAKENVLYNKDMSTLLFYSPGKIQTSFTVPNSVKTIGDYSFDRINTLTSVTIPNGVTKLGEGAFRSCKNLTEINFPSTIDTIESYALDYSAWLNNQPDGLLYIGKIAFKMIGESPKSVSVKAGTEKIAPECFYKSEALTNVTFPSTLKTIGKKAFYKCTALKSVKIPDGITTLENDAFFQCSSLSSVELGKGLDYIPPFAFAWCSNLTEMSIPDNITSIGQYAFHGDTALTKLTVPKSVTSLGPYCFGYTVVNNEFVQSDNLTVYLYKNSAAHNYCKSNNLRYILLDGQNVGDVNNDGSIDVLDAASVQKYSSGKAKLTTEQLTVADVNDDKNVDVLDAAEIQKYAAGIIKEFKKK